MRTESKIFASTQPESPIADHRGLPAGVKSPYASLKRKHNSVICGLSVRWFVGFSVDAEQKNPDPEAETGSRRTKQG